MAASATLPFVSSAAWSMTSIETGGASTPSLPAASSTFSAPSTLAAAAASSTCAEPDMALVSDEADEVFLPLAAVYLHVDVVERQ